MNSPPIEPSPVRSDPCWRASGRLAPCRTSSACALSSARGPSSRIVCEATLPDSRRLARPRRVTVAVAAAAGVMLVALCAVALRVGYQSSLKGRVPPASTSAPERRVLDSQVPAALLDKLPEAGPAVTTPIERSSKARVAGQEQRPRLRARPTPSSWSCCGLRITP